MSLRRKVLEIFATNWLLQPLGLLTSVLVVRAIGAEGKGILVLQMSIVSLVATLGHLGTPAAAVYYLRKRTYSERALLANFLVLVSIYSVLVLGLFWWCGEWLYRFFFQDTPVPSGVIWLAIAGVPVMMLSNFAFSMLLGAGWSKLYAQLVLSASVLNIIALVILVILLPFGVVGAIVAKILSDAVPLAIVLRKVSSNGTGGASWCVNGRCISDLVSFGLRQYPGNIGAVVFNRGGDFLLAYFLDFRSVGYYSVANSAYNVVMSIPKAVNPLLFGETAGRGSSGSTTLVVRSTRNVLAVMLGVVVVLATTSPWLIPFLYGVDFSQAVTPLTILLMAALLAGIASSVSSYFAGINRPGIVSIINLTTGIISLAIAPGLINTFGVSGMALAILVARLVGTALALLWFRRLAKVPIHSVILLSSSDVKQWRDQIMSGLERLRPIFKTAGGG